MALPELLTRTSPVTFGLLLVHLLLLGGRLASARPTSPPLRPTGEVPLTLDEGQKLRDLDVVTPDYALAVIHGRSSGGALLDWTRSAELERDGSLAALQLASDRAARRAEQLVVLDGRPVTVTGRRNFAWRYTWDLATRRAHRDRLPDGFLWLTDDGAVVTEQSLALPDGWPPPYPPSLLVSGHLALARPMVARSDEAPRKGAASSKAADTTVMLFDLRDGRPLAKLDTERIRAVFPAVGGSGFAWTDDSSCWLRYATCDRDGHCQSGTSALRAVEPVFSASIRPDLRRIAVCSTKSVGFYEGTLEGPVRFLGRAPLSKTCRKVVLTSDRGALALLEDRNWVVVTMEPSR